MAVRAWRRVAQCALVLCIGCSDGADESAVDGDAMDALPGDDGQSGDTPGGSEGAMDPATQDEGLDTDAAVDPGPVVGAGSAGCGADSVPGSGTFNVDVNGTQREYRVGVPAGYDSSEPHKLVFVWHGLGGNAEQVERTGFFGLQPQSDGSAIFVAGLGLDTPQGGTGWSNEGGRDMNFVRELLTLMRDQYCIDDDRIFSSGISYGGIMSNQLGCELGDEFRAIAPVMGAGPFFFGGASCVGQVAAWLTHGTADDVVTFEQGETSRDHWLSTNGCGDSTVDTGSNGCVRYEGCDDGYPVEWCPTDLAHVPPAFGASAVWNFFAEF